MKVPVAMEEEIPEGARKFVNVNDKEIVILNIDNDLHAISNFCPHMGGPVGLGPITGENSSKHISCPFHAWRFCLDSGEVVFPSRKRLKKYPVSLEKHKVDTDHGIIYLDI